ncbi:hypothetical protein COOONC_07960 [Cooperia oncophora]
MRTHQADYSNDRKANVLQGYVETKHPEERRILEYFRTLDVPEATALLDGAPRVRPDPPVNQSMEAQGQKTALKGQDSESGWSMTILVIAGAGAVFVVLCLIIIACSPFIIKFRRARRKKWLERTWDMRVREAALELEQQSAEQKNKKKKGMRRRGVERLGSAEPSKDGSKEKSKESGSKDRCGSKEGPGSKDPIVPKALFLKHGDDPFGSHESKYTPVNLPANQPNNQPPGPPAPQQCRFGQPYNQGRM